MTSNTTGEDEAIEGSAAPTADVPDFEPDTNTGLEENVLGALAYLFGIVGGVAVSVLESDNEFARFHGAQSAVFSAGVIATHFVLGIFWLVFALLDVWLVSFLVSVGIWLFTMAFGFATFLIWVYLRFTAYTGERTKLPVIGTLVEKNLV